MSTLPETPPPAAPAPPGAGRREAWALALWTVLVLLVLVVLGLRHAAGGEGSGPEILRFSGAAPGPGSLAQRLGEGLKLVHFSVYPAYPWLLLAPYVFRVARRHPFEPAHWVRGTLVWALAGLAWLAAAAGFRAWSAFAPPDVIVFTRLEVEETRRGGDGADPHVGAGAGTGAGAGAGTGTVSRTQQVKILVAAGEAPGRAAAWTGTGGPPGSPPGIPMGEGPVRIPRFEGGSVSLTSILLDVLACASIAGVAHARQFHRESRDRERRALALEASLTQARLHALQSQLQPHFLFNTLNSVAAMLREDPRVAEEMLVSLSDLLRLVLSESTRQESTLREDLRFVELYVEIQQYRFGGMLRFETGVPPELWACRVPRLLLQPLVENAIRHGLEPAGRPVTVRVTASRLPGERLAVVVEDDGVGCRTTGEGASGRGLGLSNVRARLSACFGSDAAMTLPGRGPEGGFAVRLEMPIRSDAGERGGGDAGNGGAAGERREA